MPNIQDPKKFAHDLTGWFRLNKRDLPFRMDKDPYRIFVSELMLQQTQIDTMIPYYERFMARFPNVKALADANLDEVMALWAGLGYYRRARFLHESARMIRDDFGGVFPSALKDIESLKGVGRYTARAIHSIAFGEPSPAVDGNVMRVMARVTGYDKDIKKNSHMREIESSLKNVIVHAHPGDFTEALMEIGALVCKKRPVCEACPLSAYCFAYEHNMQDSLPVVSRRAAKHEQHFHTFVIRSSDGFLLTKRPDTGLLGGMFAFPQYEGVSYDAARDSFEKDYGIRLENPESLGTVKHIFTHRVWHMRVLYMEISITGGQAFHPESKLESLPTAHGKIVKLFGK